MDKKDRNKMDGKNEADYENIQCNIKDNDVNSHLSIYNISKTDESVSNQSQQAQRKVKFHENKFQTGSQTDVDAFLKKDACVSTNIPNSETDEVVSTEGIDVFVKIFEEIVRITLDEDSKVNKEQVDEIEKENDDKLCTSGNTDNFVGVPLQKAESFYSLNQNFVEFPDSPKTSVSSISKSNPTFPSCGKKSSDALKTSLMPIQLQSQTEAMVDKAASIATATHPKYSTGSLSKINASKISEDFNSVGSGCRIKIVVKSDNHLGSNKNAEEFVLNQSAFDTVKKILVNLSQLDKSQACEINRIPNNTNNIKRNNENSKCNCKEPFKSLVESSEKSINVGQTLLDSTEKSKCICNKTKVSNGCQVMENDLKSEIDTETWKKEILNRLKSEDKSSLSSSENTITFISKRDNSTITRRIDRYDVRPLRLFPIESRNLEFPSQSDSAVNRDYLNSTINSKSIRSCCTLFKDRH